MIRRSLLALIPGMVLFLAALPSAHAQTPENNALACWTLPNLLDRYVASHVAVESIDEKMDERMVELWAERMDPSRSLLTQAEYDKLKGQLRKVVKGARTGDCAGFDALHKQEVAWQKDMETFTRKYLSDKKLTIDKSLTLQVNVDKRKRPANAKERDDLRRRVLQFQLANLVRNGTPMEEAKQKIIHRYELATRRIGELNQADAFTEYLNTFANALDPHSTYFSPDELEDFRISMDLALEGIGAVLSSRDGYTVVQEVVPGGAADRHGELRPEDKIIAVSQGTDGEAVDVVDMALRDVVKMIRGKKGTQVKLTVLRQTERTERHEFVITRDKIDLKEQAAKLTWETVERDGRKLKLAVIDLPSFYGGAREPGARDCTDDVRALLLEAQKGKADGVLLDLSRNGGGLLQAAVDISGLFIAKGAVVGVAGRDARTEVLEDKDPKIIYNGPLVVHTSRVSASASEILAGALQDYRRAVIVGDDQTYGKGSVQNIVSLPPQFGALKVTTALFFRPDGMSTQAEGVKADVVVPSIFSGQDIGEKFQPNVLPNRTTKPFLAAAANDKDPARAFKPVTDAQLKELGRRSKERVVKAPEFKELLESLAKLKANDGVVKLADIFEDDPATKQLTGEDPEDKKDEATPQRKEAVQVLADLVIVR